MYDHGLHWPALTSFVHLDHSASAVVAAGVGSVPGRAIEAPPEETIKRIRMADGVTLAVSDSAPPRPRHTAVFLHGFCLSRLSWKRPMDYLERRFGDGLRVIGVDHRGHGQSGAGPMHTYTIRQCAKDLAAVLDVLGVHGNVSLIGHSMGAMVAMEYHRLASDERPVDPSALVLVATAAGRLSQRGVGRLLGSPATTALFEVVNHTPQQAWRLLSRPLGAGLGRVQPGVSPQQVLAMVAASALRTTAVATAVGFLPTLRSFDAFDVLGSLPRTVVVSGGADVLTPADHAWELAAEIPDCRHVHLPWAGHMLPQQAPQLINDVLVRTIAPTLAVGRSVVPAS